MPQQKSKKILIYIFLFLIIGTFNNKNLSTSVFRIKHVNVSGLEEEKNSKPFQGEAGLLLKKMLSAINIKIENVYYLEDQN